MIDRYFIPVGRFIVDPSISAMYLIPIFKQFDIESTQWHKHQVMKDQTIKNRQKKTLHIFKDNKLL